MRNNKSSRRNLEENQSIVGLGTVVKGDAVRVTMMFEGRRQETRLGLREKRETKVMEKKEGGLF